MNSVKKRLDFSVSTKLYSQVGSPPQEATETCCKDTHGYNSIMRTTADTQRQVSSAEDVCHDTRQECRKSQGDGFVCFVFVNNADACTSIKLPRVVFFSLSGAGDFRRNFISALQLYTGFMDLIATSLITTIRMRF